jgi:FAD binding domain/D-arabinono-1,4-lactone oxidase
MSNSSATTLERPVLQWKPNALSNGKNLKSKGSGISLLTLDEALDELNRRKGANVVLLTRTITGWVVFEYIGSSVCKVGFRRLELGGLPLGGDPLVPQTYIFDGKDELSQIVYQDDKYALKRAQQPVQEPTDPWAVEAVVPVEQFNDGKSLHWLPRITLRPSLDELPAAMAWINKKLPDLKVKAGGSKHSWSKIAVSTGIYIEPDRMKLSHTFDEEPKVYRTDIGEDNKNLVRGGSGNTIKEMNEFLWLHGKSFPVLGGFDGQTLGGVFTTGTHGSVFTRGPLAEMISSIDLVVPNGEFMRIEPTLGITDPIALTRERPDLRLIQNDEYYHAALINMGTMGVVHSFILHVTEAFHMNEIRTLSNISELKDKISDGKIYNLAGASGKPADLEKIQPKISNGKDNGFKNQPIGAYHLEFLLNPHSDKVIITSRHPIEVAAKQDSEFQFEPPGRNLIRTIQLGARFSRPLIPTWFQDNFNALLSWTLDQIIKLAPRLVPGLIDSSMDTLIDAAYTDRSFNVFNVGEGTNEIPALAASIYIPIDSDDFLKAVDLIRTVAAEFAKDRKQYATGPASMRFIKKTEAMMGCDTYYCSFEFIFTASTKYALDMVEAYEAALKEGLGPEKVKVHWGQLIGKGGGRGKAYKDYAKWRSFRDEMDPKGILLSEWQEENL